MAKKTDPLGSAKKETPVKGKAVYQFKITLMDISPAIWRRILVPAEYSFWDLHVAITDCMPWMDHHQHVFRIKDPKTGKRMALGVPDEEGELTFETGWEHKLSDYFTAQNNKAMYEYDFGDSWLHEILFEGEQVPEPAVKYPRCVEGKRACPPEDVGGVPGYEEFLKVISDRKHPEYESMWEWTEAQTGKPNFKPDEFNPSEVKFDNPEKRWRVVFKDEKMTPDMRVFKFCE
ncbi:MAG: hypothetical protein C0404_04575 [Verrucomicrobia bacterium]|nr:hypothetical protein [Verrucomicrobiota bacterium]